VIHFVNSALVENGRPTELDVAVEVLASMNDSEEGGCVRIRKRRLAQGGMLAARLLQEGVLEQDKRVRHQFRKCIEPLLGCVDMRSLHSLTEVNQPNSSRLLKNSRYQRYCSTKWG
jgi:hypothetical protein